MSTINETLTALGDTVRAKAGIEGKTTIAEMTDAINNLSTSGNSDPLDEIDYSLITKTTVLDTVVAQKEYYTNHNVEWLCFENATSIDTQAFYAAAGLRVIEAPQVTTMAACGCANAYALRRVYMPSLEEVPQNGFSDCRTLRTVTEEDLPSVTSLAVSAFAHCFSLQNVTLPAATSIGASAFANCLSLQNVTLPAATSIGASAFTNCFSLQNVTLPAATSIGASAFYWNIYLNRADLPAATSIGTSAFAVCPALRTVIIRTESQVCTLGTNCFTGNSRMKIYVPKALVDSYKAAANWSSFADRILAIEDNPGV